MAPATTLQGLSNFTYYSVSLTKTMNQTVRLLAELRDELRILRHLIVHLQNEIDPSSEHDTIEV